MRFFRSLYLVLLEAPFDPVRRQMNSVLLTIDLTKAVADEAIARKDCVVVAYRLWSLSLVEMMLSDTKRCRSNHLSGSQVVDFSRYTAAVFASAGTGGD